MLGLLRLVRFLTLRRRQTGIVRGFPRLGESRFKLGNAPLGRLKALPESADQDIFLSVAQVVEIGKRGHAPVRIDSAVTVSNRFFEAAQNASGLSRATPNNEGMSRDRKAAIRTIRRAKGEDRRGNNQSCSDNSKLCGT